MIQFVNKLYFKTFVVIDLAVLRSTYCDKISFMYIKKIMSIKIKVKNSQIPLDISKIWYKI